MLVKFYGDLQEIPPIQVGVFSLPEIMSIIKLHISPAAFSSIINTSHIFLVTSGEKAEESKLILEANVKDDFSNYDTLHIIPEIEGEIPVPLILAMSLASFAGISVSTAGIILAAVGNLLIGVALNFMMNALSPTPEFSGKDPAAAQKQGKSKMFNGTVLVREQGGPVPLVLGKPYSGGVVISSGIFTEEVAW